MPEKNEKKAAPNVMRRRPRTSAKAASISEQDHPDLVAQLIGSADSTPAAKTQVQQRTRRKAAVKKKEAAEPAPVQTTPQKSRRGGKKVGERGAAVRIIPLGGLNEVGKNITVYEYGTDAFIVDCGLTFPDDSMPGVDLVIPDFSYLNDIKDRIRGLVITHGHEDHVGAIPYLLRSFNIPIYGTRLTLGLVEGKLKEHGLLGKAKLNVVSAGDTVTLGCMKAEFINVNHSIPDACALAIHTPAGIIVQTGDFKIDFTPIRGDIINLTRFGELGSHGVLALLSDSTNAERPGSTMSERTVGESFDKLFATAYKNRILVATFASNVHRVQQIVDAAVKFKRKVAVSGRSMENVVAKSIELGYLDIPEGVLIDVDTVVRYPENRVVIITTGSQGEPMSALTRMASGDHRKVSVTQNDCIIISATPIPGNEKLVTRVINDLLKLGAHVIYEKMYDIHVSGHACQDELKTLISLCKPKYFMPMHGEFKHLIKHAELARSMLIANSNIVVAQNGNVVEMNPDKLRITGSVTAGKILVDGLGVGDVGSIVLRDRKHLAQDGLIVVVTAIDMTKNQIVAGPDIVSRGFVYVRESEDMMSRTRGIARDCIRKCLEANTHEWGTIKQRIRDDVGDYLWRETKRNPMILPIVQEIY
ncbi:MAG: ribonuclease J [Oscillospiraceae bacterium]|nr:ribonuclease J [Oscillospiraceae bacterium]